MSTNCLGKLNPTSRTQPNTFVHYVGLMITKKEVLWCHKKPHSDDSKAATTRKK